MIHTFLGENSTRNWAQASLLTFIRQFDTLNTYIAGGALRAESFCEERPLEPDPASIGVGKRKHLGACESLVDKPLLFQEWLFCFVGSHPVRKDILTGN